MTPAIKHKAKVEKIVNNHRAVITTFFMRLVLGYEDKKESKLYIDLNSLELFFITKPKNRKKRGEGGNSAPSMYELDCNEGQGINLSAEEKKVFLNSPKQLYGLSIYIKSYLMPKIDEALGQLKG
jgi:hypothetical protein